MFIKKSVYTITNTNTNTIPYQHHIQHGNACIPNRRSNLLTPGDRLLYRHESFISKNFLFFILFSDQMTCPKDDRGLNETYL
jgi:hypothetical protein